MTDSRVLPETADEPAGGVAKSPLGNSAVEVLAYAPAWWSPAIESRLRKWLWISLRDDEPGMLEAALRTYSWGASTRNHAERVGWDLGKLLVRLRLALWSKSRGKGPGGKRRGLLHAAACNVSGVPEGGALRCVERLLKLCPPEREELWQLRVAVRDAPLLGRDQVVLLLGPQIARLEALEAAERAGPARLPRDPRVGATRLRDAVGALLASQEWAAASGALLPTGGGARPCGGELTAALCVLSDALIGDGGRAQPARRRLSPSIEALCL